MVFYISTKLILGSIKSLEALGSETIQLYIIPNIQIYCDFLDKVRNTTNSVLADKCFNALKVIANNYLISLAEYSKSTMSNAQTPDSYATIKSLLNDSEQQNVSARYNMLKQIFGDDIDAGLLVDGKVPEIFTES